VTETKRQERTRDAILEMLKRGGPGDSAGLAARLGISAMAVRQHLYALRDEGLVDYEQEARPKGRPAKLWRVTERADAAFPDSHGELAVGLLAAARDAFGEKGLARMIAARAARQVELYRARVPARASLRRRVEALAALRSEEGYMAEVVPGEGRSLLLVENHCPISAAAHTCLGLCSAELQVFQEVLGEGVTVERTEHIVGGSRRCAYRVDVRR
jgi:predicted ArsR family transcriptional regulator